MLSLCLPSLIAGERRSLCQKEGGKFDEAALNSFYDGLKASGMKARMFVIDDKWEGKYGKLEHSAERFPHFEEFRERVRADGLHFGLWAAFMRCQDPADMGLNLSHMLHLADGKPLISGGGDTPVLHPGFHPAGGGKGAEDAGQEIRRALQAGFGEVRFRLRIAPAVGRRTEGYAFGGRAFDAERPRGGRGGHAGMRIPTSW